MIQLGNAWIRWGLVFCVIVLLFEVLMLRVPVVSSEEVAAEQEWVFPQLTDRTNLASLSEAAANHMAWGEQLLSESSEQKPASWQLKGIVKVGADLLALVSVDNRLSRVKVNEHILDSKVEAIENGGVTVSEVDAQGVTQTRFVKIHR